MTRITDHLVLVAKTQKGTHKPYTPTTKDHDACLRLMRKLPKKWNNEDLHGIYTGLRQRGTSSPDVQANSRYGP